MGDIQKENVQNKEVVEPISVLDKKRQHLLDELSKLMDQTSGEYSPFLMEEMQQRLEVVVNNFNLELKALIKNSFECWKIKDAQLRDLMSGDLDSIQTTKSHPVKEKPKDSPTPDFIKDVKFGPMGRK